MGFLDWLLRSPSDDAAMAAYDRIANKQRERCEICSRRAVYLCPKCGDKIARHSHENDFICRRHGFVNPVRQHDGARIVGDGGCHPLQEA